ncbi:hypothetical protein GWI33_021664, partial [Rhynchophorus ferrugineus]
YFLECKRSKSFTKTEDQSEDKKTAYDELIASDPDFYQGSSKFQFPNGDQYDGEYCAHSSGLVWRQGKGIYTTKDGQTYDGCWDGDKLIETEDVTVTFLDGTKYIGSLQKNKYSGPGLYQFNNQISVLSNFADNKPTGEITLIDPNQKAWYGFAEQNESLLIPEHIFYQCINQESGKGRLKQTPTAKKQSSTNTIKSSKKSDDAEPQLKYRDYRQVEKEIFMKSKKTPSNLCLEDSDWFKEYLNYKNTYGSIYCKAMKKGPHTLNNEEVDWFNKYKNFEEKYLQVLKKFKKKERQQVPNVKIFEVIHPPQYKSNITPTAVFYPSEH